MNRLPVAQSPIQHSHRRRSRLTAAAAAAAVVEQIRVLYVMPPDVEQDIFTYRYSMLVDSPLLRALLAYTGHCFLILAHLTLTRYYASDDAHAL
eukprot:754290-Pleurochrysis_carterae.AAC.1